MTNSNTPHTYINLNSRFLPEMELTDGVTIIKATYGTGKTELIARYLDQNPNESVLYIAHLITLCEQAASRLKVECYKAHDEDLHRQKRLSICINSIYKLFTERTNKPNYHIVVIDEVEQLLSRLTDNGKEAIQFKPFIMSCLKHLIATAKKVICLDADISNVTLKFMAGCRPAEQFNVITNQFMHRKKLFVYSSEAEIIRLAEKAIAKGEHVLFATNSIEKSKEVFTRIETSNKRLINSQTTSSAENRHFMADVNSNCKQDSLTVISPSLSTGFSIEAGHYQWNLGIFSHLVNTPLDCLQQLERDRVNTDKHVFISPVNKRYQPKMVKQAHEFNMMHIDSYGDAVSI